MKKIRLRDCPSCEDGTIKAHDASACAACTHNVLNSLQYRYKKCPKCTDPVSLDPDDPHTCLRCQTEGCNSFVTHMRKICFPCRIDFGNNKFEEEEENESLHSSSSIDEDQISEAESNPEPIAKRIKISCK